MACARSHPKPVRPVPHVSSSAAAAAAGVPFVTDRRTNTEERETRRPKPAQVLTKPLFFWLPSFGYRVSFFFVVLNSVLPPLPPFFFFGGGGFQGGPESTHGRLLRGRVCWWLQLATRLQLAVGTHTHTHTPTRTYTHTHKEAGGKGEDQVKAALNTTGSFSFHRGQLFTIPPDRVAPVVAVVVAVAVVAGRRGSAGGV